MIFNKKINEILKLYFKINPELEKVFKTFIDFIPEGLYENCQYNIPFMAEGCGLKILLSQQDDNSISLHLESAEDKLDYLFEMEDVLLEDVKNLQENDNFIYEIGGFTVYETDIDKSTDYSLQIAKYKKDYQLSIVTTSYTCDKDKAVDDVVNQQLLKGVVKKDEFEYIVSSTTSGYNV